MTEPILNVRNLKKIYTSRGSSQQVQALRDVTFSVEKGEFVAIMGESGSGKSTLLNILAALDTPTAGSVIVEGMDFAKIPEKQRAAYRRANLGFVFQEFNLLDTFSLRDNIYLPLVLSGEREKDIAVKIEPIADALGIRDILDKYPYEVSGGQKQRAAAARALITDPRLILADEPTGALDSRSTDELLTAFEKINRQGQTILMVTHSAAAASRASRVMFIRDGVIFHQLHKGKESSDLFYAKITETLNLLAAGGRHA